MMGQSASATQKTCIGYLLLPIPVASYVCTLILISKLVDTYEQFRATLHSRIFCGHEFNLVSSIGSSLPPPLAGLSSGSVISVGCVSITVAGTLSPGYSSEVWSVAALCIFDSCHPCFHRSINSFTQSLAEYTHIAKQTPSIASQSAW